MSTMDKINRSKGKFQQKLDNHIKIITKSFRGDQDGFICIVLSDLVFADIRLTPSYFGGDKLTLPLYNPLILISSSLVQEESKVVRKGRLCMFSEERVDDAFHRLGSAANPSW